MRSEAEVLPELDAALKRMQTLRDELKAIRGHAKAERKANRAPSRSRRAFDMVRAGASPKEAAISVGIKTETIKNYMYYELRNTAWREYKNTNPDPRGKDFDGFSWRRNPELVAATDEWLVEGMAWVDERVWQLNNEWFKHPLSRRFLVGPE